jgi:GDP-mannose 6-dehydrogenase
MNQTAPSSDAVVVIGMGYVGCVTAACLASLGHSVIGVDPDLHKVNAVKESRSPFYEPGLDEIVRVAVAEGHLTANTQLGPALEKSHIALICVGTPSGKDGNLNLTFIERVADQIRDLIADRKERLIVVIRSTVVPGTCERVAERIGHGDRVSVVSNPEFLREGSAVKDFNEPSLTVVGGKNQNDVERVAALYKGLKNKKAEPCQVALETAELIKYACNAFHAVKIQFANEIGTLAAQLGINGNEVMTTLASDKGLNASAAYLKPGFAFGGSCLPKDLKALSYQANSLQLELPLLQSVLAGNSLHLERAVQAVLALPAKRLGVLGLAFKENTDDLRESPVLTLVQKLRDQGRELRIWDPHIQIDQIYGSNLDKLNDAGIQGVMLPSAEAVFEWADHLVITQNPSPDLEKKIAASKLPVLDLARRVPGRKDASMRA